MQNQSNRRKYQRVPVSFRINCLKSDLSRIGGKVYNLSEGGVAIKTNFPVSNGEELTMEFVAPDSGNVHSVRGEVVWSHFHADTVAQAGAMFTVGIKFIIFERSFLTVVGDLFKSHRTDNVDKLDN
jgi:Tfp pilus assembly protein PilZ